MNGPIDEWVIVCAGCDVATGGHCDSGEAEYLAGIHNDLHHGGRDDAIVVSINEWMTALDGWQEQQTQLAAELAEESSDAVGGAA